MQELNERRIIGEVFTVFAKANLKIEFSSHLKALL